ncbi:MAG: hypothetical protein K6G84_05775 [Lachnospiraceae bacterium]|nr:hypothetical protein [Lachnospiraceae bacterium]
MAEVNLRKLKRAELLEMMIKFSEDAEAADKRAKQREAELEAEKEQFIAQMAEERANMLEKFDAEKAEMRAKFNEQKAAMQAKFDKDINGLKARLEREKAEIQDEVDLAIDKIERAGNLAEAALSLNDVFKASQKAAALYYKGVKAKCDEMEAETRAKCEKMLEEAKSKSQQ